MRYIAGPMQSLLLWPFENLPLPALAGGLGVIVAVVSGWLVRVDLRACGVQPRWSPWISGLLGGLLAAGLTFAMLEFRCQEVRDVVPTEFWRNYRLPYHLALLTLLVSITATDLQTFYILDRSCLAGLLIGVSLATISGDLQMEHIWVDWSWEEPQLRPPWTPAWISRHPHLHGLAWSLTGAIVGAGLTWVVRVLAHWALDRPALGAGDVFLMAMIGSFLGWQATLMAFALAPVFAVSIGIVSRLCLRQAALPYGPFLAAGAVAVLFAWRWILMLEISLSGVPGADPRQNFALRRFLGDPLLLGLVLGGACLLMLFMLGLLRWYRSGSLETRP